jgi:casein kinase II subunit beta
MTLQESAVSRIVQDHCHSSQHNSDTSLAPHFISIRRPDFSPSQFVSSRGNEYYCEIDEDYLTDRFNLTGLNTEVQYYQYALDLVTDVFDMEVDDDMREQIEKSARHLYGLVHARYIVTTRGLAKMVRFLHQYQLTNQKA